MGNGDGPLLSFLAEELHEERPRLLARLRRLLAVTSTAEGFACEASWMLAP
jgi:hypothetical protein